MIKLGDRLIFKYPERSKWNDTDYAVREGILEVGQSYEVVRELFTDYNGIPSITVSTGHDDNPNWSLSPECFETIGIKRNLPPWW